MNVTERPITFTVDNLELRRLHESSHPARQEGEFSIQEYADAQVPPLLMNTAMAELDFLAKRGKVIKGEGLRFIDGRMRVVYKFP
jgi:hypothetical protein